ncbi:MAG: manganese ABC transporter permease [candidate division NC10 bacterium RIFCSPLOWO2_12_FULL_66_18]|nr:MAG: manganese ABC transporter permease [candidate division NC10 bacterium RIFCSPLOWO2_02_FULL_66_22]OGB99306.1 MAG: manganese ABC transporter permease [candidate division NC10 bacterium RIFCSPLOWO2_12_FULL_66_18]
MIESFVAPFEFGFMQRALVGGVLVAAICALVGTYVVLRGQAFVGDALAHAAFPGVVIAYLLKGNIYLGATVFAVATALGIGLVSRRSRVSYDTAIGIMFAGAFALGVLLMSTIQGYTVDLFGFLFGNVLGISRRDLLLVGLLGALVVLTVVLLYKELLLLSFDPIVAEAMGYPVQALNYLLLGLMALTIVISIQAVGIILVVALLVTPSATASLLTERFFRMMLLGILLAVLAAVIGLYLSYYLNVASGAAIVLVSTCLFFLVLASRRLRIAAKPRA